MYLPAELFPQPSGIDGTPRIRCVPLKQRLDAFDVGFPAEWYIWKDASCIVDGAIHRVWLCLNWAVTYLCPGKLANNFVAALAYRIRSAIGMLALGGAHVRESHLAALMSLKRTRGSDWNWSTPKPTDRETEFTITVIGICGALVVYLAARNRLHLPHADSPRRARRLLEILVMWILSGTNLLVQVSSGETICIHDGNVDVADFLASQGALHHKSVLLKEVGADSMPIVDFMLALGAVAFHSKNRGSSLQMRAANCLSSMLNAIHGLYELSSDIDGRWENVSHLQIGIARGGRGTRISGAVYRFVIQYYT